MVPVLTTPSSTAIYEPVKPPLPLKVPAPIKLASATLAPGHVLIWDVKSPFRLAKL